MRKSIAPLLVLHAAFASMPVAAAEYAPSVHEIWSGVYRCGAMQTDSGTSPAYTSSIRLIVEGNSATIIKQSAEITENLSGEIGRDGTLRLEGTGSRRGGGTGWRYRYDGRFEGSRFQARGMMFSANLATKLRDCSMSLARMQRSDKAAVARDGATPAAALKPEPVAQAQPQSTQPREAEPSARSGKAARAPESAKRVERELDFSDGNESAMVEGTVERGTPHRYDVIAREGQRLSATLQSDNGARFDLYEPGSSITLLSGGFVVQGARLAAKDEGTHVDTMLPADGKYLLLVRSPKDPAFYSLDVAVDAGPSTLMQRVWSANKIWLAAAGAAVLVLIILILRRRKRDRRMFRSD